MLEQDHYAILHIDENATSSEIKKAFHRLAKKFHPDVNQGDDLAEEHFKRINESYTVLANAELRRQYDQERARSKSWHNSDFISSMLFRRKREPYRPIPQKGKDLLHAVPLKLREVLAGTNCNIVYLKPLVCLSCEGHGFEEETAHIACPNCNGEGQKKSKGALPFNRSCERCDGRGEMPAAICQYCQGSGFTQKEVHLNVVIPPRQYSGDRLTLKGEGGEGKFGGPCGDLLLELIVQSDAPMSKRGDDLYIDHDVKVSDLLFGGVIEMPGENEEIRARIPPLSNPDTILRIKGGGFMNQEKNHRGDLYICLRLRVPKRLSHEELLLLRKIADLNHDF